MKKIDVTSTINRKPNFDVNRLLGGDIVKRAALRFPNKVGIIGYGAACGEEQFRKLTWKQVNEKANQFANAILETGLQRGDRVAIYMMNCPEFYLIHYGLMKAGLVSVPLNIMIPTDTLVYEMENSKPKAFIIDGELYPLAKEMIDQTGINVTLTVPVNSDRVAGSKLFSEFIDGKSKIEPDVEIAERDIFQILYTTGTTGGIPKGAMHSHVNLISAAMGGQLVFSAGKNTRALTMYPVFHIANHAIIYGQAFFSAATAIILRKPDILEAMEAVKAEKVTHMFASPPDYIQMINKLEENPGKYDLSSLKCCVYGWNGLTPEYDKKAKKLVGEQMGFIGIDGSTELFTTPAFMSHNDQREKFEANDPSVNCWGEATTMVETAIMDIDGNLLPAGELGELVVRGPSICEGYFDDEERTREAFEYGWFHTGDTGFKDEDGLFIFIDRIKDVIKSGGENVSSSKVERILSQHEDVEVSAVIGLPHERWIEAVTAIVKLWPEKTVDEEQLIEFCKGKLGGFEAPKRIIFVDELPMLTGGKIKKFTLREKYKDIFKEEN